MTSVSDNPVAIVTGAASGIGEATARVLVRQGYQVCLVDYDGDLLRASAEGLDEDRILLVQADVADAAQTHEAVRQTLARFGRIDGLHSNAGVVGQGGPLRSASLEDFDRVIGINVKGALLSMQAVTPTMIEQGRGSIVFTASTAGLRPSPALGVYSVSKYALIGVVKNAAADLGPAGIRVNGVAPGLIDTPAFRATSQRGSGAGDDSKIFASRVMPLGRVGQPDEVGETVAWLFSDAARYITGAVVNVDGGLAL
ncbi:Levodione reductase [Brevundimonas sp. SH203]|uniref:SDR family NAD(P)-dependent oxidoreductase n=1 Tax=Brevundimonas sp. SH203 TaxID=345167 RepID=UPI0009D1EBCA|nr:SDR family oxidoreductase [Brevundimonas sp. SH203]GAW40309.1 Levodione reductase [Brevundimonas sp. SH203]